MVFGRWSKKAEQDPDGHALAEAVRAHMTEADDETIRIVTAIAGLLGGVAYADRDYGPEEESRLRSLLSTVHGLDAAGIDTIVDTLRDDIVDIATVQAPRYSRTLLELGDRALRYEVLEMLVDLAAADATISHDEVTLLRNTATALGLDQSEYNAIQRKHRDKLSVFNKPAD